MKLPSYKPKIDLHLRGQDDRPSRVPVIEGQYLVVGYLFDSSFKLSSEEEEAWLKGERPSPFRWYALRMKIADNPNRDYLPTMIGYSVPSEIDDIYSSFWQVRIATGHPEAKKMIDDAEYSWGWINNSYYA